MQFLAENTEKFLAAARKRPEFQSVTTTFIPSVPQVANVGETVTLEFEFTAKAS